MNTASGEKEAHDSIGPELSSKKPASGSGHDSRRSKPSQETHERQRNETARVRAVSMFEDYRNLPKPVLIVLAKDAFESASRRVINVDFMIE
jgi:hypothetical protein